MKITYVGNFSVPYSTETHLAESFVLEGHEVTRVQEDKLHTCPDLFVECLSSDFVLYTRTWTHPGMVELWKALKGRRLRVGFHLDLYVGTGRINEVYENPMWQSDIVFSADGDPGSADIFDEAGVDHRWLPPAVYGPECSWHVQPDPNRFHPHVVFVGSPGPPDYHPEWGYRTELLHRVSERYQDRFRHYGVHERVRGHDLNVLYNTAAVVLGDSFCPNFTHGYYWSDRVPETIGRGGLLVHPRINGLNEAMGGHLLMYDYSDWTTLFEIIDGLLAATPERRAQLKVPARQHVMENHTYEHRAREIVRAVGELL